MSEVGIRLLKQNASAVVSRAASGETVIVTDRGRRVAQLTAIPTSPLEQMIEAGTARPPKRGWTDFVMPEPGPQISAELGVMRDEERY